MTNSAIIWFRQDLRLSDNPALVAAAKHDLIIPVYIYDQGIPGVRALGGASQWWLHHSLTALNESLDNNLACYAGDPKTILLALAETHQIKVVYWNRCYEPWRRQHDQDIKEALTTSGIQAKSYNGSLLWEPWDNCKADGTPYKVYTPFYRRGCTAAEPPREPLAKPKKLAVVKTRDGLAIEQLKLLPKIRWDGGLAKTWQIGEQAAKKRLRHFLQRGIDDYSEGRNYPARAAVSRLSPHLHFGEVSPNQVWYAAKQLHQDDNLQTFLSELAWREFAYSLLYHYPELPRKNWQQKFDRFPWQKNSQLLQAWQRGVTGYPLVDAGMRELRQTGYMHNRVRMVVASFLVKNCLLHWRDGEAWFWDNLVDADLANNSASWQWVAGCGADAAPYFRIFNPVTQGQKFDPDGEYTKFFVPELAKLPAKYLYNPWDAPSNILQQAAIELGKTYPQPIVDLKVSREEALLAYKEL